MRVRSEDGRGVLISVRTATTSFTRMVYPSGGALVIIIRDLDLVLGCVRLPFITFCAATYELKR